MENTNKENVLLKKSLYLTPQSFRLKKGLRLPISGMPMMQIDNGPDTSEIGHVFDDYPGLHARMLVKEGQKVKVGEPLAWDVDKKRIIPSYASGEVLSIHRGDRRKLLSVVIKNDHQDTPYKIYDVKQLSHLETDALKDILLETGLWNGLRSRPYDNIPKATSETPKALFVTAMDNKPLGRTNLLQYMKDNILPLAEGLQVLSRLMPNVPIYVNTSDKNAPILQRLVKKNVKVNIFSGPYPSGLPGTHIHFLTPLTMGDVVWHMDIDEIITWGNFFSTGQLSLMQLLALGGEALKRPRHFIVRRGLPINELLHNAMKNNDTKYQAVNGSVLWGSSMDDPKVAYVGRTQTQLSIVLDGSTSSRFFGWLFMYRDMFSSYFNVQLSKYFGSKSVKYTNNMHGAFRGMICMGQFEAINPLTLLPSPLLRSILVGDVKRAVELGMYELVEEDVAHFAYIDIGKNDYCGALRWCLNKLKGEDASA